MNSILQTKSQHKSRSISVRIPARLYSDLQSLREDAARAGLVVDTTSAIVTALETAVRRARAELAKQNANNARAEAS